MNLLSALSLYDLTFAGLFVIGLYSLLPQMKLGQVATTYFLVAAINFIPIINHSRWQVIMFYFFIIVGWSIWHHRSFERSLLVSSLAYLNLNLLDQTYPLYTQVLPLESIGFYLAYLLGGGVFLILLARLEVFLVHQWMARWPNKRLWLIRGLALLTGLLLVPHLFRGIIDLTGESGQLLRFMFAIQITILLLFIAGALIVYYGLQQIRTAERQMANAKINQEYSQMMAQQYTQMRRFRHDYKNVLMSLAGFIKDQEWQGLTDYFFEDVFEDQSTSTVESDQLARLVYLQNPELRNILYTKLSYALSQNLDLHVEISDDTPELMGHRMALSRMLGIVIDNAIEESIKYQGAQIELVITPIHDEVLIMIANPTKTKANQLAKINQLGYSTKGENRGLGLNNLKDLAEEAGFKLFTSIDSGKFIQEIYIPLQEAE
ncbi:sensor histidine kinase [Hutsoniella sourekii]|uniref:sensor histidine kinase n=1 Tax=Hutsoniella sourekii TaxID=87650 RepID=UPI000482A8E1|nr:GHKL domain-containing protein [Hutsoniella sourekii]